MVIAGDGVLMIREPDFFTREPIWSVPSGKIEAGESPDQAAVRELAEEAGCRLECTDLELIATTTVAHRGEQLSTSWTFTAAVDPGTALQPADPDELILEARWIPRDEAMIRLTRRSYAPLREPALRYLRTGELGLAWTFELIDPAAAIPSFRWAEPELAG
ncbi:NUDIX hydrolase [Microlunatus parietis]